MMSFFLLLQNNEFTYLTISSILSLGLIISTYEDLMNWNIYHEKGILSWKVSRARSASFIKHKLISKLNWILNDGPFRLLLILSFILSISFFLFSISGTSSFLIPTALLITRLLILIRSRYGLDGSFQMNIIVLLALAIGTFSGINTPVGETCLWFIAGELTIAYLIAGTAKICSPVWRKSYALNGIFSTRIYGHEAIYGLLTKYHSIPQVLCWGTLIFELGFPLAFLSPNLCIIFCVTGIGFHLFNAMFMGLNTFLFSFLATYPALIFCMLKLQQLR